MKPAAHIAPIYCCLKKSSLLQHEKYLSLQHMCDVRTVLLTNSNHVKDISYKFHEVAN
jgi:hypothetical protein